MIMKKIALIASLLFFAAVIPAQEGKSSAGGDRVPADPGQVPSQVTEKFNREYPGISGSWSKDGENYRVEFTDPKSRMNHVILYDRNGEVIRRESEVDQVPQSINEYYNKNYPGEQLKTWALDEKSGERSYYAWRNKEQI